MIVRDIIIRAGRSLRQAKARTLLTSLAIAVGAFTIVLSLAVGAGGRSYTSDMVNSNTNERALYVQQKPDADSDPSKPQKYSEAPVASYGNGSYSMKLLSQKDIDIITGVDGVKSVTPYYSVATEYVNSAGRDKYELSLQTFDSSVKLEYVAGNSDGINKAGVVIPDSYVQPLGFKGGSDAVGKVIQIAIEKGGTSALQPEVKLFDFKIVGVIKQSSLAVASSDALQISEDEMKILYDYNQRGTALYGTYMAATVVAADGVDINIVKSNIDKAGYDAQTAEDLMSFIFQFINVLQAILIGFGALAVLTSVFGIINTQYISVLERTQQIGLMKALGMSRRDVGRLFKLEAAWIGSLGGAIGSVLAVIVGTAANPWISSTLKIGESKLIIFDPISIVAVIVGLMLVSVVSGIFPARKASKLDPIEALRTE